MRQNWLSNRIFKSFDDIVDHCCSTYMEHADQSALENHVHRTPRLGGRRSLNLRIGIICAYHIYALCNIQGLMTRLRLRLAYIYADYFSAERRERLQITAKPKMAFWHQSGILIGLLSVSIIGALIVLLSTWSRPQTHTLRIILALAAMYRPLSCLSFLRSRRRPLRPHTLEWLGLRLRFALNDGLGNGLVSRCYSQKSVVSEMIKAVFVPTAQ